MEFNFSHEREPLLRVGDNVKVEKPFRFELPPKAQYIGSKLDHQCLLAGELIAILNQVDNLATRMDDISYKRGMTNQLSWKLRNYAILLGDIATHIWNEID